MTAKSIRQFFRELFGNRYIEQLEGDLLLTRDELRVEKEIRENDRIFAMQTLTAEKKRHELTMAEERAAGIELANRCEYDLITMKQKHYEEIEHERRATGYFRQRAERLELLLYPNRVVHSPSDTAKTVDQKRNRGTVVAPRNWTQVEADWIAEEFAPEKIAADKAAAEARATNGHEQRPQVSEP